MKLGGLCFTALIYITKPCAGSMPREKSAMARTRLELTVTINKQEWHWHQNTGPLASMDPENIEMAGLGPSCLDIAFVFGQHETLPPTSYLTVLVTILRQMIG